jgi:hypothetical protein
MMQTQLRGLWQLKTEGFRIQRLHQPRPSAPTSKSITLRNT